MELKEEFSHVTQMAMAGMRNKLIHDYFDVGKVWQTAEVDIPALIPEMEKTIQQLEVKEEEE